MAGLARRRLFLTRSMQTPASRARSHAHARRKGRFALHVVVGACAALAVAVTYRFPLSTEAAMPETVSPTSLTGVTGLAELRDTAVFRPGTTLVTQESVSALTLTSNITSVRPSAAISPLSSFSSGAVAAAVASRDENAGVIPLAEIVDPTKPFHLYVTKPGDSVASIAEAYGVVPGTVMDNNPTVEDELIQEGQELLVPRTDGIMHKVAQGETVESIVAQYDNITVGGALGYRPNALKSASEVLEVGRFVLLPGATVKPPPPPPPPPPPVVVVVPPSAPVTGGGGVATAPPASGGRFSHPLGRYLGVSDPFGTNRGVGRIHEGIDLDLYGMWNSPIFSSCVGTVSRVEYLTYSYGYHVIVDCGDGWTTLYAHMSEIHVTPGQSVSQGTQLGLSGVTGFTTGEHLHFEIRLNGGPVDPANYMSFHGY